jgi:hypothetical protein
MNRSTFPQRLKASWPRGDAVSPLILSATTTSIVAGLALGVPALADTTISSFDSYNSDALYDAWNAPTAVVSSEESSYVITAKGYGANYKFIGFPVIKPTPGDDKIQLTVTLSAASNTADGKLGPIVDLIDGDGTRYSYRWYGQTLGHHVLTIPVESPFSVVTAGSKEGLDLSTLTHSHIQLDPSSYTSGTYTIAWEDLSLVGAVIQITSPSYDPDTHAFTLTWNSTPDKTYSILHASTITGAPTPLVTGIPSDGSTTTTTVTLPDGNAGFLRVQTE